MTPSWIAEQPYLSTLLYPVINEAVQFRQRVQLPVYVDDILQHFIVRSLTPHLLNF